MGSLSSLFSVPMYKTNIGIHEVPESLDLNRSAWDGEMTSTFKTQLDVLQRMDCVDVVNWHAFEYVRAITGSDEFTVTIEQSWCNYGMTGDCQYEHDHLGTTLAGCYYRTVPEGSGEIRFIQPINELRFYNMWQTNDQTGYEVPHYPVEGDLWIWPAFVRHKVMENKSKDPRITVAFNIRIDHELAE